MNEKLGFLPLDSTTDTKMSGPVHNGYRVSIRGLKPLNPQKGSMYGMVFWQGGECTPSSESGPYELKSQDKASVSLTYKKSAIDNI